MIRRTPSYKSRARRYARRRALGHLALHLLTALVTLALFILIMLPALLLAGRGG